MEAADIDSSSSSSESGSTTGLPRAAEAAIARKRSTNRSSKIPGKKTRVAGGPTTKAKRIGVSTRLKEFPKEPFSISQGSLYCDACHVVLQTKKSIIKNHVATERHATGKKQLEKSSIRQTTIAASWATYKKEHVAETAGLGLSSALPDDVAKRRIDVVEAFLSAGIPLAQITYLRPLLEAGNLRLTHPSHLSQYIPFVMETEMNRLRAELAGANHLAVIFDGSTYQGEALAILFRYLDSEWRPQQRLVRFHVLAKSLNGAQLAGELAAVLSTTFQLKPEKLVAGIRDGAAVNRVAMEHIKTILYPNLLDVICMSHSLDNVGRHFNTPVLDEFLLWWVSLFARSPASRIKWKMKTGVAVKSLSKTRWWSTYEVAVQQMEFFGDVSLFLTECEFSPSACQHLRRI